MTARLPLHGQVRLVRIPLDSELEPAHVARLLCADPFPFALAGAWAGGGAVLGSAPLRVAGRRDDPFALLDSAPEVVLDGVDHGAVGGGWFGYLGYGLGRRLEYVPPGPPRPLSLPECSLAFYDHVLRHDGERGWWFEALWTDARADALRRRLAVLSRRLSAEDRPPGAPTVGELVIAPPGTRGHLSAVAACRERIATGEIFQANICLRLEADFSGRAVDLFERTVSALAPRYAAYLAGPWGAAISLSPELFLRRRGRTVWTEPIKGTAARAPGAAEALLASEKNRAENVMIADLMRNDLGRVCRYGSIRVPSLARPRATAGVWHLVSSVSGELRQGVGDGDLLRATFPPGSVTGAPKVQALRVIAELEAVGRELYTGAIGFASPVAGLELSVVIRTFEMRGRRLWLGVGGGIVADSDPEQELEECLIKARPLAAAAGTRLAGDGHDGQDGRRRAGADSVAAPPRALAAGDRPDPARGVFETLLVHDGLAVDTAAHLRRLEASARILYDQDLPEDVLELVRSAALAAGQGGLRLAAAPGPGSMARLETDARPLPDDAGPLQLSAFSLPGGLGAHKWRDRALLGALAASCAATPLLVDLDGQVLEAAHANVWIVDGGAVLTPPADGRLLAGTVRALILELGPRLGVPVLEHPIPLARLVAAEEVFLSSSLRGAHAASMAGREQAGGRVAALVNVELGRMGVMPSARAPSTQQGGSVRPA